MGKVAVLGDTAMLATPSLHDALPIYPEMVPLVARMVLVKVPEVVPAVNRPLELMVPPPLTTLQVTVTGTVLPAESLPVAVNCWVPLMGRVAEVGDTSMLARLPDCTVTVAKPETVPLVARTVLANVPRVGPAVNRPLVLMAPPPLTTLQETVTGTVFPAESLPVAVNC